MANMWDTDSSQIMVGNRSLIQSTQGIWRDQQPSNLASDHHHHIHAFKHYLGVFCTYQQATNLLQEFDGHFLLHVCTFEGTAELLKANHLVTVLVCFKDGALSNAIQLIITAIKNAHLILLIYLKGNPGQNSHIFYYISALAVLGLVRAMVLLYNIIYFNTHLMFSPTIMCKTASSSSREMRSSSSRSYILKATAMGFGKESFRTSHTSH